MAQTEIYTVFCAIVGENISFPIEIASSKTVGILKVMIKENKPNRFASVDADELALYLVNISGSREARKKELEEVADDLGRRDDLDPMDKLETVFPTGTKHGVVNIIVRPPSQYLATTPPNPTYPAPTLNRTPTRGGQPTYTDPETVNETITAFLSDLRPRIAEFLKSPQCVPAWVPDGNDQTRDFYRQLNIPNVNNRPSLLLHDLGKYTNPNVAGLFGGDTHRICCETSGAGKTRVVFEGLCQHWGFYFVAEQGTDRIGSRDLEFMILTMPQNVNWINNIFDDPSVDKVASADRTNEDIAFRQISQVLLARWIIFDTFIKVAREINGEALPESLKRQWLLFQILPLVSIDDMDPFLALSRRLIGVGSDVVNRLQEPLSPKTVLGSVFTSSFYYVLDEAQVAGQQYMGSFADGHYKTKRPVLCPIVRLFTKPSSFNIRIIISGTGFSLELFKTVLVSGVGKVDLWPVFHTSGGFGDRQVQQAYVSRYLPPSFIVSSSGIALASGTVRVNDCIGTPTHLLYRYRFTAGYLEEIMTGAWKEGHPLSPHKLLDAYVHLFTGYRPIDGDRALLDAEPTVVGSLKVTGFTWGRLMQEQDLMKELSCSIFEYVTRGQYPLWHNERSELVEHGIARFIDDTNGVVVQEPLALVGIARRFSASGYALERELRHTMQKNIGVALEQTLVLALTKIFRHGARLDEIFAFHEETPDWATCTAQIVSRDAHQVEVFDLITAEPILPSTGIAYYANGPVEVEHWLKNGGAGWCIPGKYMGPDLMAWLRLSDGRLLLLVIQAKCHRPRTSERYLLPRVTADALRSLSPGNFFSCLTSQVDEVSSMLDAINGSDQHFTSGDYNVLRVIAACPLDANLDSEAEDIQRALEQDDHPLATLRHLPLVASLANSDSPSILGSLTTAFKRDQPNSGEAESKPANPRRNPLRSKA